jgi:hypothetical protein
MYSFIYKKDKFGFLSNYLNTRWQNGVLMNNLIP